MNIHTKPVTQKLCGLISADHAVEKVKRRFVASAIILESAILCNMPVYAASDPMVAIKAILKIIMEKLFPAVGIVLALVGGFKLFMAFRNDQPDAYGGAAKDIVIGVVLAGFATVIWPVIEKQF